MRHNTIIRFIQKLAVMAGIVLSFGVVASAQAEFLPPGVGPGPMGYPVPPGVGITDADLGIGYGSATGLSNSDPRLVAARVIRVAMSLLGILAVAILIFAGFTWMTAGGNDEKIGEAKKWMFAGVIGLALILSAYAVATFVVSQLVKATTSGNTVNIQLTP